MFGAFLFSFGCGGGGGGNSSGGNTGSLTFRPSSGLRLVHAAIDLAPAAIISSLNPDNPLETVRFGLAAPYVSLSRENQAISVSSIANLAAPLFVQAVSPQKDMRQTLLLYGDRGSLGLRLALLDDYPARPVAGKSSLRIIHALAGASAIDADFQQGSAQHTFSAAYGQASAYAELEPGAWNINVRRSADSSPSVSASRTFEAGKAYSIVIEGEQGYLVLAIQLND